jgi:DNA-binding CsgD family transcriptional regulator
LQPAVKTPGITPARYASSTHPVRYKEAAVNYVILDNNRFYAEGLRYALLRRNAHTQVESGALQWRRSLLACDTLVVRCRFSVARTHLALVDILLQLEARRWAGTVYLVCNEKGWALATHLRKRFATLTLHIIDDRIAVVDAAYLLAKEPRRVRSLNCCLTGMEFNVLDRLVNGQSVKHVAHMTQISEKQVSTYKCNALKKLNANNLLQLLL